MTNPVKEICNRAIQHIQKQGELAYSPEHEQCLLRTPNGLSCAVGGVISDEFYRPALEETASPDCPFHPQIRKAIADSNPDLDLNPDTHEELYWRALSDLQEIHDNAESVEDFVARAPLVLEKEYGIDIT